MFKMPTDNHNFRKIVAADKKYTLRKMSLKFQNFKYEISWEVAFYIFFVRNWNPLELRGQ